ncbi:hypothetical protein [Sphingomonas sp. UYP23]
MTIGAWVHAYAPHTATALYLAAVLSSIFFLFIIYARCLYTRSVGHLGEKWIFGTVAAAAPIPTYILLMVVPFDPDLAHSVLDDRVVVALAGLYGLVETLSDIRGTAAKARQTKEDQIGPQMPTSVPRRQSDPPEAWFKENQEPDPVGGRRPSL